MAFNKNNDDFSMEVVDNFDFIIEEGSNSSVNLRKVSWNGREPKLDIRKWLYQDGQERASKGVTLSDEGANELTGVLVEQGFGDTARLVKALKNRGEFAEIEVTGKIVEDDGSEDYYNPNDLLGGLSNYTMEDEDSNSIEEEE